MLEETNMLKSEGLFRTLKTSRREGKFIEVGGRSFLDFGSNDYLGISARKEFQREFLDLMASEKTFMFGSAASRLLTGNHAAYDVAESEISQAYGRSSLIFNSGYHANIGLIPAIVGEGDLVVCDKLAHASIIDALKLCGAKWLRFAHNDTGHLRKILQEYRPKFKRALIVTESVFSMDGDLANLAELVKIKKEFDALLYVDEAHAFGVFGKRGLGLAEACGMADEIDFIMCTLGKALAGEGAFVISSAEWRELFINKARTLIFTTALPPINLRWIHFAFQKIMDMRSERDKIARLSLRFREKLSGFNILGESQIIPLVVGNPKEALDFSEALAQSGVWAPCVRWPTVPKNGARIRFSLSAAMDDSDIDQCAQKISGKK